jgi:5-methylcytosine-specific restriction protein A
MSRNPNWTTDELILALDLYFRAGRKQLDATHHDVTQLSELLNKLPIHSAAERGQDFRNPQGVSMKLGNFLAVDPDHKGAGLPRGGKLDSEVWNKFAGKPQQLRFTASAIAETVNLLGDEEVRASDSADVDEDTEFPEGKILTRLHKRRERSDKAVEQKKRKVLKETGRLICEVCDFDFVQTYGELGYGFAECHHTVPISESSPNHRTRLKDLAIVCANCHRMIHRSRPLLTVQQLRSIVLINRRNSV